MGRSLENLPVKNYMISTRNKLKTIAEFFISKNIKLNKSSDRISNINININTDLITHVFHLLYAASI